MKTYVALFRGVNVGGKSSLPMKELVTLIEDLGAQNVKTYIQSGNAIFKSGEENISQLSNKISDAVEQLHGCRPHVLILELAELGKAIDENPFPDTGSDPSSLHLGLLAHPPKEVDFEKIETLKKRERKISPEGVGRSKLAVSIEKLLGVPMTDRNWKPCVSSEKSQRGLIIPPNPAFQ